jgi:hypothetical protein
MKVAVNSELSSRVSDLNNEIHALQNELDEVTDKLNKDDTVQIWESPYAKEQLRLMKLIHEKSEELRCAISGD